MKCMNKQGVGDRSEPHSLLVIIIVIFSRFIFILWKFLDLLYCMHVERHVFE